MQLFSRLVYWAYSIVCKLWNRQFYRFSNISPDVKFAPAFPGFVKILSPQNCRIGKGTVINADSVIHCAGGVTIGNYVHIGHGLCIYSSNHNYNSENSIPYDENDRHDPVLICDHVWIGSNVSILPGVTISEGVVVGMGSVVTCDFPAGAIIAGNPAKIIGFRNMNKYLKLKKQGKFF